MKFKGLFVVLVAGLVCLPFMSYGQADIEALQKKAENGNEQAQFKLGKAYANGDGVSKDLAEAMKWFRLAAEQGHALAQVRMGNAYDKGRGVPQDSAEAVKWFRLAAEQGNTQAQSNLTARGEMLPSSASAKNSASEQENAQAQSNLTAKAEKLPPPADGEYAVKKVSDDRVHLAGKVIKVKFSTVLGPKKQKDELYVSMLTARGGRIQVIFPQEGLGFFSKFFISPGIDMEEAMGEMYSGNGSGQVYVQVSSDEKKGLLAVGDEYKKDGDEGEYRWSVKTEIPDLAANSKVPLNDVLLFPDQLKGKIVELEFYRVREIKGKSVEEYTGLISAGNGHPTVKINFPAAGHAFFQKIKETAFKSPKSYTVYALINVNPKGVVSLEAKGTQVSGEGSNAEYRW